MNNELMEQLRELMELAQVQGRIEGITAATNSVGGFISLVENGTIGDDWLDQLRKLRNGMTDILLVAEFEQAERINRA